MIKTRAIESENGNVYVSVTAPKRLSFNLATEETAQYFSQIKEQFDAGRNVQFDFSNVEKITIDGLVILLGFIKNYEVNRGHLIDFVEPLREDPRMLLRRFNVFKKVPDKIDGGLKPIPMIKVSNTIVANGVAKDLTRRAALSLYGKEYRIKEFYEILIELMANTNNHASPNMDAPEPWFAISLYDEINHLFKFAFIDLGIGIFESWPVQQYIRKVPAALSHLFSFAGTIETSIRNQQLDHIFSKLSLGKIGSRTNLAERGKGLPLLLKHAQSQHFSNMILVTNDGHIDLKNRTVSCMNENLSGTLFYLELQEVFGYGN